MRFFLVAQSLHQLKGKYGEDADTIKGNCDNWVFLTSKELDLLREISELCGTLRLEDKVERRLISVSELQRLDKQKGETLIMHARQYPIITEIADIDDYEMFKGYEPMKMKPFDLPNVSVVTASILHERVENGEIPAPFSKIKPQEELKPIQRTKPSFNFGS
jgi:type IV secretion system protein VirD4